MYQYLYDISLTIHYLTPSEYFWILSAGIVGALLIARRWYEAGVFTVALVATTGTIGLLKMTLAVARPEENLLNLSSYAFPSGHAGASMFLAVMAIWLMYRMCHRHYPVFYVLVCTIAFIIGISRIFIAAHTPLQVAAGFAIGILVPMALIYLFATDTNEADA